MNYSCHLIPHFQLLPDPYRSSPPSLHARAGLASQPNQPIKTHFCLLLSVFLLLLLSSPSFLPHIKLTSINVSFAQAQTFFQAAGLPLMENIF